MRLWLVSLALLVSSASAQVATGTYANGTFDNNGVDSINVGSLNLMLTVPILHKAGRAGTNFTYDMGYNGSIWTPTDGAWVADQNWGWQGQTEVITGYLDIGLYRTSGSCFSDGKRVSWTAITGALYHDAMGVNHYFGGTQRIMPLGTCPGVGNITTLIGSTSTDGKYKLGSASVTAQNGVVIVPPISSPVGAGTYTDTNGNQITTDGSGHFTDTSGNVVLTVAGTAPSNQTFTYTDDAGTSRSVVFSYHSYSIATNFGCSGVTEYSAASVPLVDTITMPDSSTYHFTYEATPGHAGNVTGRLATMTVPNGGVITYAYSGANNGINCADGSTLGISRTLSSIAGSPTRTYTRTLPGLNSHTTVVDASLNYLEYDFVPGIDSTAATTSLYETALSVTNGSSGTPLIAQQVCYNGATAPCTTQSLAIPITRVSQTNVLDGVTQDVVSMQYDAFGELTSTTVSDFGSATAAGPILESESRAYSSGFITSDVLSDAVGPFQETRYLYDTQTLQATSGIPQHTSANSGNLTEIDQYISPRQVNSTPIQAHVFEYYDTGSLYADHTVAGGVTHYSYDSTNTHPTTITPADPNGVGMASTATYHSYLGTQATATDANGTVTSATANDYQGRPTEVDVTSGGTTLSKTTYSYWPTNGKTAVVSYQSGSVSSESDTFYDVYGRTIRSAIQSGSGWYVSDICYDGNGRVSFQSYPYSASSLGAEVCVGLGDTYSYDALGRTKSVVHGDPSSTSVSYTYLGAATETTNENSVSHLSQVDALGRLKIVCEVSGATLSGVAPTSCGTQISGTGFVTSYAYSTGNTVSVTQGTQSRLFYYDGLGRLATKVESEAPGYAGGPGTTYSYSTNTIGQVVTRTTERANQTDLTQTTTATTQYDALGRRLSVIYSDGITPTKTFTYDAAPTGSTFSAGSAKGRMTVASTGSTGATTLFSYDALGRVQSTQQCIPGWCATPSLNINRNYGYDWASNKTSEQYSTPSGTVSLGYGVNLAGQVTSVSGGGDTSLTSLYAATSETPYGPTASMLGNGISATMSYDTFGRKSGLGLSNSSSPLYAYTATWQGQHITSSSDSVNGSATYGYDDFSRLQTAAISTGLGTLNLGWSYDRYGNRLSQSATGTYTGTVSQPSLTVDPTSNRITNGGYNYDAAGNLMSDGANTYTYDAEGRVVTVSGGTSETNVYDALKERVMTTINGTTLAYGFNLAGQRSTVWDASGNLISAQYYAGSRPLAYYLASDGHVHFQHQDWIGTERIRTTSTGTVDSSFTSLPFGDSLIASGSDTEPYHYASLDSDTQDLQHATARHLSTVQGRWLRPDPYDGSYNFGDPQSLNRYSYVENSPLVANDPSGLKMPLFSPIHMSGGGGGGFGEGWDEFGSFTTITSDAGSYTYGDNIWDSTMADGYGGGNNVNSDNSVTAQDGTVWGNVSYSMVGMMMAGIPAGNVGISAVQVPINSGPNSTIVTDPRNTQECGDALAKQGAQSIQDMNSIYGGSNWAGTTALGALLKGSTLAGALEGAAYSQAARTIWYGGKALIEGAVPITDYAGCMASVGATSLFNAATGN
jgi:RHS repeat-associated protein